MSRKTTGKSVKRGKIAGKNQYRFGLAGILLLFLLACLIGKQPGADGNTQPPAGALPGFSGASLEHKDGELEVHFIDVGQGDATLLIQGGHAMLIDAGGNDKGTAVQYYLMQQDITKLDYLIGTHPDEDHIGGLDVVLYKFDVDRVFMPAVSKDTKTYRDVLDTAKAKNMQIYVPEKGDSYQLGDASFTVLSDEEKEYSDINDASICIRLVFGDNSFLFCGDAGEEAEVDLLKSGAELESDIYKASHHGSATSGSAEFLEAVSPRVAVISCGKNNSYGHPDPDTVQRLLHLGADVYRTDEQGTIKAVSDGNSITWSAGGRTEPEQKSGSQQDTGGEETETDGEQRMDAGREEAEPDKEAQAEAAGGEDSRTYGGYILNTGTKKYHLPQCGSVARMNEENREETDLSKEELEQEGYTPCKICNP